VYIIRGLVELSQPSSHCIHFCCRAIKQRGDTILIMDTRLRISESAQSCKTYFCEYLESPCPGATRIAKDQLARFNLWASNIAVFAPDSHASLDKRLSDSCHDGIRQMIFRLLEVIGKDLELGKIACIPARLRTTG
jgi:hypothetical protein